MLATGHQVVSSVTTREIVMTEITPTSLRPARGGLTKAKIFRDIADFVIPVFQAPMPIRSLLRQVAQTNEVQGTIKSTSFRKVCIIDYF